MNAHFSDVKTKQKRNKRKNIKRKQKKTTTKN